MKKKVLAALLALVMVFSLTACDSKDKKDDTFVLSEANLDSYITLNEDFDVFNVEIDPIEVTDEQINISYGLTDIRYEWHKGSVEGEVVSNPIGVGKYVLVAYLEETETTKAVSVISDIFEIKSAPDNELGGGQKTTYTISYELNGGENSPENPSEYIEGAEDIVLKNPARKGYTFQGWYTDSGCKTKISNI